MSFNDDLPKTIDDEERALRVGGVTPYFESAVFVIRWSLKIAPVVVKKRPCAAASSHPVVP